MPPCLNQSSSLTPIGRPELEVVEFQLRITITISARVISTRRGRKIYLIELPKSRSASTPYLWHKGEAGVGDTA